MYLLSESDRIPSLVHGLVTAKGRKECEILSTKTYHLSKKDDVRTDKGRKTIVNYVLT